MCIVFSFIIPLSANPTKWSKIIHQQFADKLLVHFVRLVLKGLCLLNTLIFMRNLSRNIYIWHVQAKLYLVVSAIPLYLIGCLSCSLILYILSTAFMLRFFLVNLGIWIYLENQYFLYMQYICICIYMCVYIFNDSTLSVYIY